MQTENSGDAIHPPRLIVLLGAGASADAGLKLTSALAAAVVERANVRERRVAQQPDWVRAINAVYAGMVGYRGARGENPLASVNIETLISAVRLLRDRDHHEVSPFVASWSPALSDFASETLPSRSGAAVVESIGKALGGSSFIHGDAVARDIARIARAAIKPDLGKPFADAESFILRTLVDLLSPPYDVSYLNPLIRIAQTQPRGLDVMTLNYDLTVETAAATLGVNVNRGIETWRPGQPLDFDQVDGTLNLLKLHGSLDWRETQRPRGFEALLASPELEIVAPDEVDKPGRNIQATPWIVVGDREKLATDGPTLLLNAAARVALNRADHLVIVGYSFSDAHINAMIRDWLNADERRTITILDKTWPRERTYREIVDFRSALIATHADPQDRDGTPRTPRVHLVEGGAREQLDSALSETPRALPTPVAVVSVHRKGANFRIDITWRGHDLTDARISIFPPWSGTVGARSSIGYSTSPFEGEAKSPWDGGTVVSEIAHGETRSIYVAGNSDFPLEFRVTGATLVGAQFWEESLERPAAT